MTSEVFKLAFSGMFIAIVKILIVALTAGILVRRKIVTQEHIKSLSDLTVNIFLPALVVTNIIETFVPSEIPNWWLLPLVGLVAPVIFLSITALLYLGNIKNNLHKLPIAAFQNAGYLVLPIGQLLYTSDFDKFTLYVFLYTLGFTPIFWTLGKFLLTRNKAEKKFKLKELLTPPFVANILGILLVFSGLARFVPMLLFDPVKMIGSATVPVATFILGATLGAVSLRKLPMLLDIFKLSFIKYFLIPAVVIIFLIISKVYITSPLLADFLVIEASAAPAANLIVMVRKYGGNAQLTGGLMLVMYILAIVTMPLTIAVWKMLIM
jgi:predicted permease